ncbi:hypothetical protein SNEBB_001187 [Seison nebaliae]|nr:hypothetical protein SNEBB_001187 [Seison nebaliae]
MIQHQSHLIGVAIDKNNDFTRPTFNNNPNGTESFYQERYSRYLNVLNEKNGKNESLFIEPNAIFSKVTGQIHTVNKKEVYENLISSNDLDHFQNTLNVLPSKKKRRHRKERKKSENSKLFISTAETFPTNRSSLSTERISNSTINHQQNLDSLIEESIKLLPTKSITTPQPAPPPPPPPPPINEMEEELSPKNSEERKKNIVSQKGKKIIENEEDSQQILDELHRKFKDINNDETKVRNLLVQQQHRNSLLSVDSNSTRRPIDSIIEPRKKPIVVQEKFPAVNLKRVRNSYESMTPSIERGNIVNNELLLAKNRLKNVKKRNSSNTSSVNAVHLESNPQLLESSIQSHKMNIPYTKTTPLQLATEFLPKHVRENEKLKKRSPLRMTLDEILQQYT